MSAQDQVALRELLTIAGQLTESNIGESVERAIALEGGIQDPIAKAQAYDFMQIIRGFARGADMGWPVYEKPIRPGLGLTEMQALQLVAVIGTLMEFNYAFERAQEASTLTFEYSAPVRFYMNGIFNYLTALFLLNARENKADGFDRPGSVIRVLQPIGIGDLIDPVYRVLDRKFGEQLSYGETILAMRNKGFVHGSFSPANIEKTVKDSDIFDATQRQRFMDLHWDIFHALIVLRLRLISIVSAAGVPLAAISPSKLYHL